jgi:hypothetical protein
MSFLRSYVHIAQLLDVSMSPYSASSDDSREASPLSLDTLGSGRSSKPQTSPFLQLPNDLFKCVLDYLNRDSAWALKRLCRGMANSKAVDELLYRYPLQLNDVRDIRLNDWKFRSMGQMRWKNFQVGRVGAAV